MGPWLGLLNAYATAILDIFNSKKIMRLEGLIKTELKCRQYFNSHSSWFLDGRTPILVSYGVIKT